MKASRFYDNDSSTSVEPGPREFPSSDFGRNRPRLTRLSLRYYAKHAGTASFAAAQYHAASLLGARRGSRRGTSRFGRENTTSLRSQQSEDARQMRAQMESHVSAARLQAASFTAAELKELLLFRQPAPA